MELNVILAIITFLFLAFMGFIFYISPFWSTRPDDTPEASTSREPVPGPGARSQRSRMRANAMRQRQDFVEESSSNENVEPPPKEKKVQLPGDLKMGAKKQAKLEEKARKKAAREEEEQMREERRALELIKDEERKQLSDKEKAEELLREDQERKEIEEREKREYDEYLKMKAEFSVEGEGYDEEGDLDAEKNLLKEFVDFIKMNKVVVLEDLAAQFKLKTQAAIDRIATLQSEGVLTGVVDDRGKFIYISQQELENVAKFIKQRGRVSIVDLVESSNELINLVPSTV
ncbi:DDRGK domain containing 1 [Arctopsyche grandis]|uniref:DDRGK domain containing 1 n=1 Tax=Arctopsyche grandis TaxID=121162 RepID=UPI00406D7EDF